MYLPEAAPGPISQMGKLRPQLHVCSLDLICCSPLRQEYPGVKGVPLAEKVNLHVSWPSVGLSVLDCGSREQMTPLVRAQLLSSYTACGPVRRREPTLVGAAPLRTELLIRAAHKPRLGGSLSLASFGLFQPQILCTAAQSSARAGHSPTSIPTLPEVTSSVCVITHSLGAGSEWVCPVPTQWAFQNSLSDK